MTLRRFLTRLIWFSLAPLLLLAVLLAADHVRDTWAAQSAEAQRLARVVAVLVQEQLDADLGALQALAASPLADTPARWAELHEQARGVAQHFGMQVIFAGTDRHMRFHTALAADAPLPALPRPDGRSAMEAALSTGRPAVGDLFIGPIAREPMVALAAPGLRQGRPAFAMLGVATSQGLAVPLADAGLPGGWSIALRDGRDAVIARHGPLSEQGSRRVVERVNGTAWTVEVHVPRADHLMPLLREAAAVALAVAGATLAGLWGGGWAGRRLTRALQSLVVRHPGGGAPQPIEEFAAVRRQLDEADHARDHAEGARRDGEARHRISMEQATLALQVREGLLRGVFDSATDAILTANAQQMIVMANPAAAKLFGWPLDQLVGMPLASLVPEHQRAAHERAVRAFGDTGVTARDMGRSLDLAGLRADGSQFPIEASISHVHVDGQRLYTVILRDITERRRAEQALLESRARLAAALASMNDAIFITDAAGQFIDFNEAFASFFRFRSKAECPRHRADYPALLEVSLADGTPADVEQWPTQRALRGESATLVEYRVRRKDSGEAWIGSFSFAPIRDAGGAIAGAVVTARDITGLRAVQADLEASHAELRRLVGALDGIQEAERTRIARELHDDLQQTLAAVLMETTAARAALGAMPPPMEQALATIDRLAAAAIVSTRRIVNDLRPQMLEELGLVPALEAMAARFAERSGVACKVLAEGLPAADERRADQATTCLYRVAQEALNNVAKHAGARQVLIRLTRPAAGRLRLQVRDDGRGHTPQDRRKPDRYGLLGMRERLRAVGGTLLVTSEPGAGTEVQAEVPVDLPAAGR